MAELGCVWPFHLTTTQYIHRMGKTRSRLDLKKRMIHTSRRHRRWVCISQPPCFYKNNPRTIIPPTHHIHIYLHDLVREVFERPCVTDNPWYTYGNILAWLHVSRRGTVIWVEWNAPYFFFWLFCRFSNARISSLYARSIRIIATIMVREISLF